MSKSFKLLSVLLILCILLTGCSSSKHLKDLVIVEGMGLDKEDGAINMIVQTLDVGINNGTITPSGNMTVNTEKNGETITDCINNLSKALSKRIFLGQNKLIVIGRSLAEESFAENLDYFLRSAESRPDVAVCLSDSTAKDIIESKENDSAVPCENILYLISNNEKSGLCALVTTSRLINAYMDKTSDIYLPVLEKKKDENVNTAGIGIFSDDKLVYVTNDDETSGFVILTDQASDISIEAEDESLGRIGVKLTDIQCRKTAFLSGDKIIFSADVTADMIINEIENGISTDIGADDEKRISTAVEDKITQLCTDAFNACKAHKSDSLRVGEQLACNDADAYERLSDDWDTYFQLTEFSVNAEVRSKKISDNTQAE